MPFFSKNLLRTESLRSGNRPCVAKRLHSLDGPSTCNRLPPWPRNPCPSPYEVLGIEAGKAYNKANFRSLVKLYHPDVHGQNSAINSLPRTTRLERYHLIVAAHELLSDQSKRKMYDYYNVG
ncbi:hypothetical protein MRS44_013149 [Fusarium solani]|uniref:uncharacterized protein n=1 Tax=Fusarium solani TaxID=169388 RepID=UPI0032C4895B|nr:hypothetical protein MRS44_013149 [Fusarium solani]